MIDCVPKSFQYTYFESTTRFPGLASLMSSNGLPPEPPEAIEPPNPGPDAPAIPLPDAPPAPGPDVPPAPALLPVPPPAASPLPSSSAPPGSAGTHATTALAVRIETVATTTRRC